MCRIDSCDREASHASRASPTRRIDRLIAAPASQIRAEHARDVSGASRVGAGRARRRPRRRAIGARRIGIKSVSGSTDRPSRTELNGSVPRRHDQLEQRRRRSAHDRGGQHPMPDGGRSPAQQRGSRQPHQQDEGHLHHRAPSFRALATSSAIRFEILVGQSRRFTAEDGGHDLLRGSVEEGVHQVPQRGLARRGARHGRRVHVAQAVLLVTDVSLVLEHAQLVRTVE